MTEYVESILSVIRETDPRLCAFVSVANEAKAVREAETADRLIGRLGAAAWQKHPLLGITVAVKDSD